ncbi:MAG: tetratricopeptide repeat protein [Treponema sp.]|jgi:tetratricopeptide (TPR) repeat protein|nr:tetratricopeptide repeat protein [Treponema sp.]
MKNLSLRFFAVCAILVLQEGLSYAQTPGAALTAVQNYRIGRDLEADGRQEEADRYYNEAVRQCLDQVSRNTANRDTYAAITWSLQRQKKYRDVVSWGNRGLQIFADDYRIVETMGEAYFYLDDYDRSLEYMQRYTNAVPQGERTSVAYFFIAEIYRLRNQYFHADIAYTAALRLSPEVVLWWYRLALVRESAGDYINAIPAYQRVLRLDPNHREAQAGLNRVQARGP